MVSGIENQLREILEVLERNPDGMSRGKVSNSLSFSINNKTLQRRLVTLCDRGDIIKEGDKKATKYYSIDVPKMGNKSQIKGHGRRVFSLENQRVLKFLENPLHSRETVSYKRGFLEEYVPNETSYVPVALRKQLFQKGKRFDEQLVAGTYARQICRRLLIDLSYHSSRLEGNTYSRLDTQKMVEEGVSAEGKIQEETVMIMNHKEAILFLIENAESIELDCFTLFNLHNLLSQDLLANPQSCGRIRSIPIDIGKSAYKPLDNPHTLREMLELVLVKANKINDPFEQSFFVLVHLSNLQAFEDVNKRTSRIGCNIPFIKQNLCPLSFTGILRDDYTAALLAVYELNDIKPMLDLFTWAYSRSCHEYEVAKESLGEIDTFHIQYRPLRKQVMGQIVRNNLHREQVTHHIEQFCQDHDIENIDKFLAMTVTDLDTLHTGAIVGLGVTESQFNTWFAAIPVRE